NRFYERRMNADFSTSDDGDQDSRDWQASGVSGGAYSALRSGDGVVLPVGDVEQPYGHPGAAVPEVAGTFAVLGTAGADGEFLWLLVHGDPRRAVDAAVGVQGRDGDRPRAVWRGDAAVSAGGYAWRVCDVSDCAVHGRVWCVDSGDGGESVY